MSILGKLGNAVFGGGNSSSQVSSQETIIDNDIDIEIDLDKLANTLRENSLRDIFFQRELAVQNLTMEQKNLNIQQKSLNIKQKNLSTKEKEQRSKDETLKLSKMTLQQQMKSDKVMQDYTLIGIVLTLIIFIFNSKGGK